MEAKTELILFIIFGVIAIGVIAYGFTLSVIQYRQQKKKLKNDYSHKLN
jgi:glucose uptake protein GlcU